MRAVHLLLPWALAAGTVLAQTPSSIVPQDTEGQRGALQEPEQLGGRSNQRTERIHIEDAGTRVDELRVGGRTQVISVQPKANVPVYEVQSPDGARSRAGSNSGAETTTAPRVWNVLKF